MRYSVAPVVAAVFVGLELPVAAEEGSTQLESKAMLVALAVVPEGVMAAGKILAAAAAEAVAVVVAKASATD